MTTPGVFGRRAIAPPTLPRGEVLGTYESHAEAQQVVNRLAEAEFEVAQVAIIGSDLKTVERVTGRMTYGRAAAAGAASGAWFGLFFGLLLLLIGTPNPLVAGAAILIGAAFGMLFGIASYAITRRSQDYTSATQVLASSYQIIIAPELLTRAQEVLARPAAAD